ncbi:hypothetical protein PVAP13_1NG136076 [Panicum virgatum]|uniref:DUF2921 domain-containing protein n=1 Tax=Panicum virgatum TaxID=38727 RepID=A0A8T0WXK3_PANVG|nr:hypothetical protein PVAP13_1NG136076 [Panicum virgatum]
MPLPRDPIRPEDILHDSPRQQHRPDNRQGWEPPSALVSTAREPQRAALAGDAHAVRLHQGRAGSGAPSVQGFKPAGFRDSIVSRSLLSYPSIAGPAEDMVSLSSLADDLNLRFQCVVKPPFVPEWIEEPFFELQILSVGALVGSYPQFQSQFLGGFSMRIEQLGRARVHAVEKQQILNVSAEFTASRKNFVSPSPVMSLEGVYNPEDGRMYLVGCRNVHAPWRVLSKRRDLEDGMDCSIEMTVEYPPTTTRWLISRAAKVSVASTRGEDDPLHFNRTELRTLPVAYRHQRRSDLTEPLVEGLLCVTMLSATVAATAG